MSPLLTSQRTVLSLALGLAMSINSLGQLPVPELIALGRLGGTLGQQHQPIEGAVGTNLANSKAHWLALENIETVVLPESLEAKKIPVRAINELGLSNSRNFLLTRQAWNLATNNESASSATEIRLENFYQDECVETGRNYYRFHSETDQVIRMDGLAQSLDSRARLVMSIQTADNRTLAMSAATHEMDPSLEVKLLANQDYRILVHDQLFRGGGEYRYAIFLTSSLANNRIHLQHPRASFVRAAQTELPEIQHSETTAPSSQSLATTVAWPCRIAGAFQSNSDMDEFDLMCEQNVDLVAETISQRIGESTDCALALYRVDNAGLANEQRVLVAENDDMQAVGNAELRFNIKDPLLRFRIPQTGLYRLIVRNQQRQSTLNSPSGSAIAAPKYTLELRRPNPGFVLAASWSSQVRDLEQARISTGSIPIGGIATIAVHAVRFDGFDKPIQIQVDGLPANVQGGLGVIAENQNFTRLQLLHDGTVGPQTISPLQLIGTSADFKFVATPVEFVAPSIDTFRASTSKVSDSLVLQVSETRTSPLSIELGAKDPMVIEGIRGTPIQLPLRVTRRPGGEAAPILFRLLQGPAKVTSAEVKIEPNINEGTIELQIPKDTPLGESLVCGLCETTISFPNPDPNAPEKTISRVIQLPTNNVRIRIGDAP